MVWLGLVWKEGLARVVGWEMDRWAGVRMGQKSKKETGIFKLIPGWVVVAISFDFGALFVISSCFSFLFVFISSDFFLCWRFLIDEQVVYEVSEKKNVNVVVRTAVLLDLLVDHTCKLLLLLVLAC